MPSIFLYIDRYRCDSPEPVKFPQPQERATEGEPQNEATTVLSKEHLPHVPRQINSRGLFFVWVVLQLSKYEDLLPMVITSSRALHEGDIHFANRYGAADSSVGRCRQNP